MSEISSGIQESVVSQPKQETADAPKGIGLSQKVDRQKLSANRHISNVSDPTNLLTKIAGGELLQSSEGQEAIAETTGRFYVSMLNTFLQEGFSPIERREQIEQALDTLPERLKKIYKGIIESVEKRLTTNKTELDNLHATTADEKVRALFTAFTNLEPEEKDNEESSTPSS